MKTLFFSACLLASFLLMSCAGSKEARAIKSSINGKWHLETITIEGNSSIMNVSVFNEAGNTCFVGSSWDLVGNNGSGSYTLMEGKGGCSMLMRKIKWSIYEQEGEEKKFQFKRLDDNNKPLDDNNGYRLTINSLTDSSMKLSSQITFDNRPVNVVYNFLKK